MTVQEIKKEIIEALDTLSPEALEGVLEYVAFITKPEEVAPTAEELAAIERGEEEFRKGAYPRWRDVRRNA